MLRMRRFAGMFLLAGALGGAAAGANTETVLHSFVPPREGVSELFGFDRRAGWRILWHGEFRRFQ